MIPWALIIAIFVLIVAYTIKKIDHVIEEDHPFMMLIGAFFALYIVAALGVYLLNPRINTNEAFATSSVDLSLEE
jgi:hypothetical protein